MPARRNSLPLLLAFLMLLLPHLATGQVIYQPSPQPDVTAEEEEWYVYGDPIVWAGDLYYPTGPTVYFDGNDMARSGQYQGIPLYAKSTIEPYSKVFVPISGGLMQPYEKVRAGDLAGTTGSTAPSFPVVTRPGLERQLGPPPRRVVPPIEALPREKGVAVQDPTQRVPEPAVTRDAQLPEQPPLRFVPRRRSGDLSDVFIIYGNRRWYSSGPAVELEGSGLRKIGEYRGFPVYARRGEDARRIYVLVAGDLRDLVAPYSLRR